MMKLVKRLSGWRTSLLALTGLGLGSTEPVGSVIREGLSAVAGVLTGPGAEVGGTAALIVLLYQAYKKWSNTR